MVNDNIEHVFSMKNKVKSKVSVSNSWCVDSSKNLLRISSPARTPLHLCGILNNNKKSIITKYGLKNNVTPTNLT